MIKSKSQQNSRQSSKAYLNEVFGKLSTRVSATPSEKTRLLRRFSLGALLALSLMLPGCGSGSSSAFVFEITIENISTMETFTAADGTPSVVAFSSGVFAVHKTMAPIFTLGEVARQNGLEAFAEDADLSTLLQTLGFQEGLSLIGFFDSSVALVPNPENPDELIPPASPVQTPLVPGEKYRFLLSASSDESKASILLQFLQSNDVFISTPPDGIPLFDAPGVPRSGDITGLFSYYDAGTEVNEAPGLGENQTVRQAEPNTGADEGGVVRTLDDGFTYPSLPASIRVIITPVGEFDN